MAWVDDDLALLDLHCLTHPFRGRWGIADESRTETADRVARCQPDYSGRPINLVSRLKVLFFPTLI